MSRSIMHEYIILIDDRTRTCECENILDLQDEHRTVTAQNIFTHASTRL